MNNLFYLHPAKCGGHSIHSCLKDENTDLYHTNELQINQKTLELLKSDQRSIICGHIGYLPRAKNDEQKAIKREILKILFFKSDLIMPVRNPSNLLQSWMHYAKTRSNTILQNLDKGKHIIAGKDRSMLLKMSPLKQNCIIFSDDRKSVIKKGSDFPCFNLKEEDEEWNLHAFIDFLKEGDEIAGTLPQLCSLQYELFRLDWREIKAVMKEGKAVKFNTLPATTRERKVFYYDCEYINSSHRFMLDQAVAPGFSERLLNTKKNASENKCKKKGSDFDSVNKKLQKLVPGEWQIYEMSKVNS